MDTSRFKFKDCLAVSEEKKFLFLRNPKTASTALVRHLANHVPGLVWTKQNYDKFKDIEITDDYYIFGFCRDPLDRFLSACGFLKWRQKEAINRIKTKRGRLAQLKHFYPQREFLPYGKVYRYENVKDSLKEVCRNIGISEKVPRINVTTKKPKPTEETVNFVWERYQKDYQHFGYLSPFLTSL